MIPSLISCLALLQAAPTVDWPGVGNDPGCMRYSGLSQINRVERRAAQAGLDLPHGGA